MDSQKRKVGIFFSIGDELFATEINYRSKMQFEKLIDQYTENAEICDPNDNAQMKFISIENILNAAMENLPKKQRINKLLINLIAQNLDNSNLQTK